MRYARGSQNQDLHGRLRTIAARGSDSSWLGFWLNAQLQYSSIGGMACLYWVPLATVAFRSLAMGTYGPSYGEK